MSGQNPESAMAQLNLITNAHTFLEPSIRLEQSTRSALPTVEDQSASLQLSNASRQMANALKDLKACVGRAQQVCGSLEIEVTADVIDELRKELEEFRVAADAFDLKPLPGESADQASFQLSSATKAVGSKITQLTRVAAGGGSREEANFAARDTANALRDFTAAVRGTFGTSLFKHYDLLLLLVTYIIHQTLRIFFDSFRTHFFFTFRGVKRSLGKGITTFDNQHGRTFQ